MASRRSCTATMALFLALNILFFTAVSACKTCPTPTPKPKPKPKPCPSPASPKCPRNALKLGACADLLGGVNIVIGSAPVKPCCSLLEGLADADAALCLCTALKARVLGINLKVPVSLSVLLNACSRKAPKGFECA